MDACFQDFARIQVGSEPSGGHPVDLDRDGELDLLFSDTEGPRSRIAVLLAADAAGAKTLWSDAGRVAQFFPADLDGDRQIDLAVALEGERLLRVFSGASGFQGPPLLRTSLLEDPLQILASSLDASGRDSLLLVLPPGPGEDQERLLRVGLTPAGEINGPEELAVTSRFRTLVAGDLDGNGSTDLAWLVPDNAELHVLWNQGGTFSETTTRLPQLNGARLLAAANVAGSLQSELLFYVEADAALDVLTYSAPGQWPRLQRNEILEARYGHPVPTMFGAVVSDWNRDGKPDLLGLLGHSSAVLPEVASSLALIAGDGGGKLEMIDQLAFVQPVRFAGVLGASSQWRPRVVAAEERRTDLLVLPTEHGWLQANERYVLPVSVTDTFPVDLDRDGRLDLLTTSYYRKAGCVLRNRKDGTFEPETPFPISESTPFHGEAADFTGDGSVDLATLTIDGGLQLQSGDGKTFGSPRLISRTPSDPDTWFDVADLDGDGTLDLVKMSANTVTFLGGTGDGHFTPDPRGPLRSFLPDLEGRVLVGDYDADGRVDVAQGGYSFGFRSDFLKVFYNEGGGSFTETAPWALKTALRFKPILSADFDGDGASEILDFNYNGIIAGRIKLPRSRAFPLEEDYYEASIYPEAAASADLNGDGLLDVALAGSSTGTEGAQVVLLLGSGSGPFRQQVLPPLGETIESLAVVDMNGDGSPDLVASDIRNNTTHVRWTCAAGLEATRFVRGNCDGSGEARLDVTDAYYIVSLLFRGGAEPGCLRACDTNDDDELDLTDAIRLLGYLFGGAGALPSPFPECGAGSPGSRLTCGSSHSSCALR